MPALRVSAARGMDQVVHRVGLPWGGLGLFVNVGYQQRLIEQGCDVFIAGESDNYGFRFAAECGIPMIETSHELSENDGLQRFVDDAGLAGSQMCSSDSSRMTASGRSPDLWIGIRSTGPAPQ